MSRKKLTEDMVGYQFNHFTVVDYATDKFGRTAWVCRCKCGNETTMFHCDVKNHRRNSCVHCRSEITEEDLPWDEVMRRVALVKAERDLTSGAHIQRPQIKRHYDGRNN